MSRGKAAGGHCKECRICQTGAGRPTQPSRKRFRWIYVSCSGLNERKWGAGVSNSRPFARSFSADPIWRPKSGGFLKKKITHILTPQKSRFYNKCLPKNSAYSEDVQKTDDFHIIFSSGILRKKSTSHGNAQKLERGGFFHPSFYSNISQIKAIKITGMVFYKICCAQAAFLL